MKQKIHSSLGPRQVRPLDFSEVEKYADLRRLGIGFDAADLRNMIAAHAAALASGQDSALTAPLSTPSVPTPVQFLQAWLPGFVRVITAARRIDALVGVMTQGSWEDEEIVQGVMELTGRAVPYNDYTNVPLSSWNTNFERRTIVRFEEGMQVGKLEELRAAAIRANSSAQKREASAESLEIQRNKVGFYGYNNGANRTYGFLNDPSLPAYVNVPNGASGSPTWARKTFQEIKADILTGLAKLRVQSQERIDPKTTPITLAVSTDAVDYMAQATDYGITVADWLRTNYPNVRVESAPELVDANGADSVFYLYAESVGDSGSDDNRTFIQVVPTKFQTLGVQQKVKAYEEGYTNATAGVMVKRPYAVVRYSGI